MYRNLIALILILVGPLCSASETQLPMFRSIPTVRSELRELLNCKWQINDAMSACPVDDIRGVVNLYPNKADNGIESVEIDAIVDTHDSSRRSEEQRSRRVVEKVLGYLVPNWQHRSSWLETALDKAKTVEGHDSVEVDGLLISVDWHQFAELDDTYADITVSRGASTEHVYH
jgi:hypothetical protein